ncbi:unnamed protein product [Calypogeia fissa]
MLLLVAAGRTRAMHHLVQSSDGRSDNEKTCRLLHHHHHRKNESTEGNGIGFVCQFREQISSGSEILLKERKESKKEGGVVWGGTPGSLHSHPPFCLTWAIAIADRAGRLDGGRAGRQASCARHEWWYGSFVPDGDGNSRVVVRSSPPAELGSSQNSTQTQIDWFMYAAATDAAFPALGRGTERAAASRTRRRVGELNYFVDHRVRFYCCCCSKSLSRVCACWRRLCASEEEAEHEYGRRLLPVAATSFSAAAAASAEHRFPLRVTAQTYIKSRVREENFDEEVELIGRYFEI